MIEEAKILHNKIKHTHNGRRPIRKSPNSIQILKKMQIAEIIKFQLLNSNFWRLREREIFEI